MTEAGRVVYEWEQSLDEVNVYIKPPTGVRAEHLDVKIQSGHARIAVKGNPPYIDNDLWSRCKSDCSFWTMGLCPPVAAADVVQRTTNFTSHFRR